MKSCLTDNEMKELMEAQNRYSTNMAVRNMMYKAIVKMHESDNENAPHSGNTYPELFRVIESKISKYLSDLDNTILSTLISFIEETIKEDKENPLVPVEKRRTPDDEDDIPVVSDKAYLKERFADKDIDNIIHCVTANLFQTLEIDSRYNEFDSIENIKETLERVLKEDSVLLRSINEGKIAIEEEPYNQLLKDTTIRTGSEYSAVEIIWSIFEVPEELKDSITIGKYNIIMMRSKREAFGDSMREEELEPLFTETEEK